MSIKKITFRAKIETNLDEETNESIRQAFIFFLKYSMGAENILELSVETKHE